jgi:polysaccharide chain length determinant protein (PEP-CTERM system associated)
VASDFIATTNSNQLRMENNEQIGIAASDVKRVLRKYWWIVPIAAVACGGLGLLAAKFLPKRYTSTTLVLVDQPAVPTDYVKPVISQDLNRRLASMQEQILSRTRLLPIIDKFGLYNRDQQQARLDDLVARLRKAVVVRPMESMPGTDNHSLPGFYIEVTFDSPQRAQQMCSEITSMFLEQNTREREQQASRTTSFLNDQLLEAKQKLDEQDAKLAFFKQQYLGSLPEEEQTNLGLLSGMNSQLEANVQALSRAQQDKAFTESILNQQLSANKATQTGLNSETAEQRLNAMQEQLVALRARYTPEHPDVLKLEQQIEDFKKRLEASPKTKEPSDAIKAPESAEIQQLRAKLRQDDLNIADLTERQRHVQDAIRQLQDRLQASPVVEQRFKEITRNYQTALDFYNDLLKKKTQSVMASDLEHQQESEQFRVLDPPSLPEAPAFPKKTYFAGGGFAFGVFLALAILYLIATSNEGMYSQRDVETKLNMPVLAMVPELAPAVDTRAA